MLTETRKFWLLCKLTPFKNGTSFAVISGHSPVAPGINIKYNFKFSQKCEKKIYKTQSFCLQRNITIQNKKH